MISSLGTCGAILGMGVCPGDVIVDQELGVVGGIVEEMSCTPAIIGRQSAPAPCDRPGAWPPRLERDDMANDTCSVEGCDRPVAVVLRGWCSRHYTRWRLHGSPTGGAAERCREPLAERFWRSVAIGDPAECWEWQGNRNQQGYGLVKAGGKNRPAHRVAYELTHGPIPDGLLGLHRCDNPPCVNPDHLWAGTQAANVADMFAKGRQGILRGSATTQSKLTDSQALEIRRLFAEGALSHEEIGRRFGVCSSNVRAIGRRLTWRHL